MCLLAVDVHALNRFTLLGCWPEPGSPRGPEAHAQRAPLPRLKHAVAAHFALLQEGTLLRVSKASWVRQVLKSSLPPQANSLSNISEETDAMERVQEHKFVDLSKAVDKKPDESTRRSLSGQSRRHRGAEPRWPRRRSHATSSISTAPDGPRPLSRPRFIVLDKRFKVQARQHADPAAVHAACCGPKARPGTASAGICSGATFPTTCRCAGSKRTATCSVSAPRPATATATRSTTRAGRFPASTATAASSLRAQRQDHRAGRHVGKASRSTPPTTPSCIPTTAPSGSPIPATAA